jgi:peptidoglycan L-alanyl-D-glutamate endopeptidase CwlK
MRVIEGYDCTIICGHRDEDDQNALFKSGSSRVKWPNSKHNPKISLAVDVAPHPIDWTNTRRFYHFAGYVQARADAMGIKIRWGGDWDGDKDLDDQKFFDLIHFEFVEA